MLSFKLAQVRDFDKTKHNSHTRKHPIILSNLRKVAAQFLTGKQTNIYLTFHWFYIEVQQALP